MAIGQHRLSEPGLVKCEGNCSRICALCELGVYGGDYPDRLVLFDSNGDPSFESQCRYIMPASGWERVLR